MKISLINSLIYTKKYISANMNFSNSFHSNPVSFGNDSFKKNDNAFEETDRLRKRYEKANKDRIKVYDSSLESQEQRLHDNEKTLREYKNINAILDKSDKQNYSKDFNVILKFIEAMENIGKDKGFNRISGYEDIKEKLKEEFILTSIMKDRTSQGADVPNAVLFYGPSRNGKTLFAQALAEQSLSNIVTIDGGEEDAMEMIKDSAQKALKIYNEGPDKKRTIIVINEAELLANKCSFDLEEFKNFIKDCSSKYKCTLFLTSNIPLHIDKEILNQISFKVPVEPANRKICKEIIVDKFNTANIKPEGNIDNLVNTFFVNPEKIYSNGDIVSILMLTLQKNQNATISDFIKILKEYEHTSITSEDIENFEDTKKELVE